MKKYKNLVTIGCSFTFGAMLENIEQERYGKLLADKLGVSETNLSKQGGSNDRIFRKAFNWIIDNRLKCKDSLMLIGITELYREELYSVHSDKYCKFQYPNIESFDDIELFKEQSKIENYDDVLQYLKCRLLNFVNAKYFLENLERNIILINTLAKEYKLDIVFLDTIRDNREIELQGRYADDQDENELYYKLDFIERNNLNWFMFPNKEKNWKNYLHHVDDTYTGNHPNKKHHEDLSNLIWEYLNENFK